MALRPWEGQQLARPWEAAQFVYPRTIAVYRLPGPAAGAAGLGAQGYQEVQTAVAASVWASTPIYSGIACSIQEAARGVTPTDRVPGDVAVPLFRIFIPLGGLAKGALRVRDYLQDEIGGRYAVTNPYWDSLGYRVSAILLET
jgi:hypothetical protein